MLLLYAPCTGGLLATPLALFHLWAVEWISAMASV